MGAFLKVLRNRIGHYGPATNLLRRDLLDNAASEIAALIEAGTILIQVVDEREKGLTGYYIDAKRFDALRTVLAALDRKVAP